MTSEKHLKCKLILNCIHNLLKKNKIYHLTNIYSHKLIIIQNKIIQNSRNRVIKVQNTQNINDI